MRGEALRRPFGARVDSRKACAVAEHIVHVRLVIGVRIVEPGDIDLLQAAAAEEHHIPRTAAVYRIGTAQNEPFHITGLQIGAVPEHFICHHSVRSIRTGKVYALQAGAVLEHPLESGCRIAPLVDNSGKISAGEIERSQAGTVGAHHPERLDVGQHIGAFRHNKCLKAGTASECVHKVHDFGHDAVRHVHRLERPVTLEAILERDNVFQVCRHSDVLQSAE